MPPTFYNLLSLFLRLDGVLGVRIDGVKSSICFLVCRYASSLGLAARQFTQAIDTAFYGPIDRLYQLQPSFHTHSTEPEPTARARRAGEEFY